MGKLGGLTSSNPIGWDCWTEKSEKKTFMPNTLTEYNNIETFISNVYKDNLTLYYSINNNNDIIKVLTDELLAERYRRIQARMKINNLKYREAHRGEENTYYQKNKEIINRRSILRVRANNIAKKALQEAERINSETSVEIV